MDKRGGISKDKLASGLLRGAVVSGLTAGLAAASLGGIGTANATCIGISGINIGTGCVSTLGSFALGLGPGTTAISAGPLTAAIAVGLGNEQTELTTASSFGLFSFAWAGGPDTLAETRGNANLAVMQGANGRALAGSGGTQFENLNIAINVGNGFDTGVTSLDPQTNTVATVGQGNIAVNFFGGSIPGVNLMDRAGWSVVRAGGLEIGLPPTGFANAAYNFFGDGNQVTVGDQASNFGLGFSVFGDRNVVDVNGPAAAGGVLFQSDRLVELTGPGIEIGGVPNSTGTSTNVLAAGGTQANGVGLNSTGSKTNGVAAGRTQGTLFRLNSTGSNTNGVAATSNLRSGSPGGPVLKSIKKVRDQLAASNKKVRDSVNATRGGAKAGADSTSSSDK